MFGRLIAIAAAIFALTAGVSNAQMMGIAGGGLTASASSYTGPGDIVVHTAFYSCARAYSNAYAVALGNLCKLRATTGGETCVMPSTPAGAPGVMTGCSGSSNGESLATFCASGCTVAEAYDQTGNGWHLLQATAGDQPALTISLLNSLPGWSLTSTSVGMNAGSNITPAGGSLTMDGVFNRSSGTANPVFIHENASNNRIGGDNTVSNKMQLIGTGNITVTANDATWHSAIGVATGSSTSGLEIDGSNTTGTVTVITTAGAPGVAGAASATAEEMEAGFIDGTALNSTQITNLCRNEQAAYGSGNFGAVC